jgi:hypothetical protein
LGRKFGPTIETGSSDIRLRDSCVPAISLVDVRDATMQATREQLPTRRGSIGFEIEALGLRYHVSVGHFCDGRLAEIFIDAFKAGSAADMAARDAGITASLAFQMGLDPEVLRHALCRDVQGNAISPLGAALDVLAAEEAQ